MVLTPWEGGGGGGGSGKIIRVEPPYTDLDVKVIDKFFRNKIQPPTVIYVPFDPNNPQLSTEVISGAWPYRVVGDRKVFYSPNLHRITLKYYSSWSDGTLYVSKIPVLIVDYSAVLEAFYAGPERPQDRPLDWQLADWKHGYMLARVRVEDGEFTTKYIDPCAYESPRFGCMPGEKEATVHVAEGWWWVKYNASLLELPVEVLTTTENVFKFYYRRPQGVIYRIPGFNSIAEYVYKTKLSGHAKEQLASILGMFGWEIDEHTAYRTDGGKWVKGVYVEETSEGYVVYLPVRKKVGEMGLQLVAIVIGLAVIAVSLVVASYNLYRMEAEKTKRLEIVVNATKDLMEEYNSCVEACGDDAECRAKCAEVYNRAIETVRRTAEQASKGTSLGEIADIVKWGVIGVVAVNLLSALPRRRE